MTPVRQSCPGVVVTTGDETHHETAVRQDEPVYFEQKLALRLGLWDLAPYETSNLAQSSHSVSLRRTQEVQEEVDIRQRCIQSRSRGARGGNACDMTRLVRELLVSRAVTRRTMIEDLY